MAERGKVALKQREKFREIWKTCIVIYGKNGKSKQKSELNRLKQIEKIKRKSITMENVAEHGKDRK